jgi:hypothetical protein
MEDRLVVTFGVERGFDPASPKVELSEDTVGATIVSR